MTNLHHIAIVVGNIREAVEWYMELFDIAVSYHDRTWALLQFENISIALVRAEHHPPHIAFECSDAERYGKLITHRDGTKSTYMSDPWGNTVEIMKSFDTPSTL